MTKGGIADVAKLAEELREAYATQIEEDPDFPGLTSLELGGAWGVSDGTVSMRLNALHAAGKLETGRRYVESIDGVKRPSPVYRIKE